MTSTLSPPTQAEFFEDHFPTAVKLSPAPTKISNDNSLWVAELRNAGVGISKRRPAPGIMTVGRCDQVLRASDLQCDGQGRAALGHRHP
jgi:hypothetical protein